MPSLDLFAYFQKDLILEKSWYLNGKHYARTSELWIQQLDANRHLWLKRQANAFLSKKFSSDEDAKEMEKTLHRFRTFFLAVVSTTLYICLVG